MRKNLLLALLSFLFAFLILEGAVRILNLEEPRPMQAGPKKDWALVPDRIWIEHHPRLGWYHQKNKDAIHTHQSYEVRIRTNQDGFRSMREYAEEKPAGVTRILALGDSFTFGFGVEDAENFPAVLEAAHPDLEAINLGVAGYGVDQILMAYREIGAHYHPDYVVISIFPEDFWRSLRAFADTGHAKPYFVLNPKGQPELRNVPVPQPFTLRTNQFPEVIQYGPVERLLMQSAAWRLTQRGLTRLGKNFRWIDPDTTAEWILGKALLKTLIEEIRASGSQPVLVLIAPERWMAGDRKESVHKSVIRLVQSEKVDFIDLAPDFREAVGKGKVSDFYIPEDGHWTVKGHQLVASILEKYLKEQGVELAAAA